MDVVMDVVMDVMACKGEVFPLRDILFRVEIPLRTRTFPHERLSMIFTKPYIPPRRMHGYLYFPSGSFPPPHVPSSLTQIMETYYWW